LLHIAATEKNKQALDNVCGTLARLCTSSIQTNFTKMDFNMVRIQIGVLIGFLTYFLLKIFEKIFEFVPLKTDYNEYWTLFTLIEKTLATNMVNSLFFLFKKIFFEIFFVF